MTTLFMDGFGRHWWLLVLYGVVGVLVGVYAVAYPLDAAVALAWAIGVMALAEGVMGLAALLANGVPAGRGWVLLYALVSLLFGLLAVINPMATAGALLLVMACWFVIAGVFRLLFALSIRRHVRGEWVIALSGLLGILLGTFFLAEPLAGLVVATVWFGAGALIYGVLQIAAGLRLKRLHANGS
ncbi:HdeD family acid-resistance protein [Alloalcanivorax gelatiniphagus]|uniref:HdeD family acid-resistance protein n=1 Tax=Alloalcanivorax gelatiniphagus TaxID=1194167 RepID=A0ABY2XHC9_9GAMM|nr:DUF308 domain-containing protein [Alloalcanivorax gelatiniphagus]TMW11081.1 HdeD family acid-resistance protein [Alloalcanivorax gelatiniphagus]|tara:strand:+ start:33448 stop:34002 length:555 start_codon:yes stop_codon:yes gene_type:complete